MRIYNFCNDNGVTAPFLESIEIKNNEVKIKELKFLYDKRTSTDYSLELVDLNNSSVRFKTKDLRIFYHQTNSGNIQFCYIKEETFKKYENILRECYSSGLFYYKNKPSKDYYNTEYRKVKNNLVPTRKNNFGTTSKTFIQTENKKYTFGLEIETASGRLPEYLDQYHSYTCERDGSITGKLK